MSLKDSKSQKKKKKKKKTIAVKQSVELKKGKCGKFEYF